MDFKRPPLGNYGMVHGLWLALCKLYTVIFFRGCRLVRLPVLIRGRKNIQFGPRFVCGYLTRLDAFGPPGCITFGEDVQINDFVHIGASERITIGNHVLIASRVFISDHDHGHYGTGADASSPDQPPSARPEPSKPVTIGDNVWIGEGAAVLSGVTIGAGSVIGAGAVVTRDIPPGCIAVGIPARVIRRYNTSTKGWENAHST